MNCSITVLTTLFLHLEDILVTPIYFGIIAFVLKIYANSRIKDKSDKKKFLMGAIARMIGGIFFGLIYEFVYHGGDTSAYWYFGTKVTSIFLEDPILGFRLFFNFGNYKLDILNRISHIQWHNAPEFLIILISGFIGFFSFKVYSVITLFFALFSFSGSWAMYKTFIKLYPQLKKELSLATLFIPSVVFWGGGLMKDSLCIGALGWLFWAFYQGLIEKKNIFKSLVIMSIMFWLIFHIKVYILIAFFPPALLWIFNENSARIKNKTLRILSKPVFFTIGIIVAIWGGNSLTEGNAHYDIDNIAERTKINSTYLYAESIKSDGSGYSIGELDGTLQSMIAVIPQAINVALFRPYIFEIKNAPMLLSALEAGIFLLFTLKLLIQLKIRKFIQLILGKPIVTFCITFSLILAAAVGMNSFNFGTLVRYKIPFLPFYMAALFIMKFETSKYKQQLKLVVKKRAIKSFAN